MLPAFVHHVVMNALMGTTNLKLSVMGSSWNFNIFVFERLNKSLQQILPADYTCISVSRMKHLISSFHRKLTALY
jgi:alpha-D-ribose 1-methylphosphonate 5-triphosphate diphosphatase PhnM